MKYTNQKLGNPGICLLLCALLSALAGVAVAQAFGTTTVQGTVYQANGAPGSGTLQLSWPAFTTAANQAVAAGRTTVSIASDGFVSVKLAPNVGAMPAGLFYTAVYHLSDGTTSTEYWVVPAAAQAALAQVRAQVMPAAQAVQAVNKAYVDQSIAQLVQSQVTSSGGTLTGPLYLNGDPVTSPQAATKHYVDSQVGQTLSINGGAANGPLTAMQLGAAYQADQFRGSDFGAKLQACISALDSTYGGSCDARNFAGTLSMASNLSISKGNVTINLPCATIATSSQIVVTAGTRNVTLHGCASRGTSAVSGSQGGTVFMYSGSAAMIQVGDATYAADTLGFHLDNVVVNTTSAAEAAARAITVWRAQEVHLESLYLLGNANQTGITLDGTGNYTGGTFQDIEIGGFQTALNAIGHQVANAATTDWLNASTFVRLHIVCPTSNGNPIAGTTGINLAQGDGNTFTGGDVESCATALHLGTNAQNNTIVGLRNENSTNQVVADAGSAYNNWITGGTMFTGKLTDNGTRNSFLDTFHRSFNALNGDWFGSQQDATITNHYRLGIGSGNERGLLHRYQTDSGYRWTMGLSEATAGAQYYTVLDELNNVNRLSIGQYNTGQGSSNNQTVVNAAGTGAVVLNGSNNAGSGGVVFGSGWPSSTTVATINNAGNAQFNGSLQVSGASTFLNSTTIKNQADAEIDAFLWAGATAPQKESVVYKDFNGNSQWYMVKDTSNNWALNSAVGGVDSFKAYQSNNSGDTYIDAANNVGVVRVNYEPGSGSAFNVYGGSSGNLYASFNGTTGIKFPGLAAGSGHNCVQIDNSGYLSNTGSSCAGSSVGTGTAGQIAYYPGNGSTLAGVAAVPVGSGGTGATSASGALASLGGLPMAGGTLSGSLAGTSATFSGNVTAQSLSIGSDQDSSQLASANAAVTTLSVLAYGAKADWQAAACVGQLSNGSNVMFVPCGTFTSANVNQYVSVGWYQQGTPPWGTTPSVAKITAVNDAQHIVLSQTATVSENVGFVLGTDLTAAANRCALAAASLTSKGGVCTVPAGSYLMATSPYYVLTGAQDDGAYGQPGGGSGALVAATVSAGSISGYTVTNGGGGYRPNSSLQVTFSGGCSGPAPCGYEFALANTNSSGVVTSVTNVYPGFGLISAPTVNVIPLGGDGAAATATISGGAMNTPALTAGGAGYYPSSTLNWYALGGGCTSVTSWFGAAYVGKGTVATNVSGAASGTMTVTSNATGCSSAPTIIFGDAPCNTGTIASPVWGQCSNVAPLNPTKIPVQVMMLPGVSFQGVTGSHSNAVQLNGTWDAVTVDTNQPAMFGGYLAYEDISGLYINNAMWGILAVNNANYAHLEYDGFGAQTGIGLYTQATDIGFSTDHLSYGGYATRINGGNWSHRTDFGAGGGGFYDAQYENNILARPQAYGGPGSVSQKLDDFFANYFWHPEFSAASTDFPETCKFPQAPNQRQTGHVFNFPQGANAGCYRGITSLGMAILARDTRSTGNPTLSNLTLKNASRYIFYGDLGAAIVSSWSCEGCINLNGAADPYRNAATQEGAVVINEAGSSFSGAPNAQINGLSAGSNATKSIWSVAAQGDPKVTSWVNVAGTSQPTANPQYVDNISFKGGITLPVQSNMNTTNPISFYNYNSYQAPNVLAAQIQVGYAGLYFLTGISGTPTDTFDILSTGVTSKVAIAAPALTLNGGMPLTGSVGDGGKVQETGASGQTPGKPVAFDSQGNTVNATAANIVGLFSNCTGTQALGADGVCHTASGGGAVFFKMASTPMSHTGTTTKDYVGSVTIPAGAMGTTSQLHIVSRFSGCANAGSPAGCTAANTGYCTPTIYYAGTTGGTTAFAGQASNTTAIWHGYSGSYDTVIQNNGSLTSQTVDYGALGFTALATPGVSSINTANTWYLNFYLQNSVSTDQCFIDSVYAELIP